jgi:hypothetical protein
MMVKKLMTGLVLLILAGCENYQLTLNQRELYSPPTLFTDYQITETISDQDIVRAEQLTALICTYSGIETLSGLGRFTQLETVNLANNRLKNIKPLLFLGQLQRVNISDNPDLVCADIKPLKDLVPNAPLTSLSCPD